MIDKQAGAYVISCDSCDEVLETEAEDFDSAIQEMKEQGWKSVKTDRGWEHMCPQCQ